MGNLSFKQNKDRNDLSIVKTSSCGLTEYWNQKRQDFNDIYFNNNNFPPADASDFRVTTILDEGSFGSVALTTHNRTGTVHATKVIAKKKIVKGHNVSIFQYLLQFSSVKVSLLDLLFSTLIITEFPLASAYNEICIGTYVLHFYIYLKSNII